MDNLEYLNQISSRAPAPAAPARTSLLDNKLLRIVLGALLGIGLLLIILLAASGSGKSSEPAELANLRELYLRTNNLTSVIGTYNKQIKNSSLRFAGSSLSVVLENSKNNFSSLLESDYGVKPSDLKPESFPALASAFSELSSSLETARLNGLLDRTYANEMAYEISVLLILENSILEKTSSETLVSALKNSSSSLETLSEDFSKYSESSQ